MNYSDIQSESSRSRSSSSFYTRHSYDSVDADINATYVSGVRDKKLLNVSEKALYRQNRHFSSISDELFDDIEDADDMFEPHSVHMRALPVEDRSVVVVTDCERSVRTYGACRVIDRLARMTNKLISVLNNFILYAYFSHNSLSDYKIALVPICDSKCSKYL